MNFTRYYFCTDAGTLYAPHMLCTLLGHMESNPDCGACCGETGAPSWKMRVSSCAWNELRALAGHQRIMHYRDQMDPEESMEGAREKWSLWTLRSIQVSGGAQNEAFCHWLVTRVVFVCRAQTLTRVCAPLMVSTLDWASCLSSLDLAASFVLLKSRTTCWSRCDGQ